MHILNDLKHKINLIQQTEIVLRIKCVFCYLDFKMLNVGSNVIFAVFLKNLFIQARMSSTYTGMVDRAKILILALNDWLFPVSNGRRSLFFSKFIYHILHCHNKMTVSTNI